MPNATKAFAYACIAVVDSTKGNSGFPASGEVTVKVTGSGLLIEGHEVVCSHVTIGAICLEKNCLTATLLK